MRYKDIVETSMVENTALPPQIDRKVYWDAIRQIDDQRYNARGEAGIFLDGVDRKRSGTRYFNPQAGNVERVADFLNSQVGDGHYYYGEDVDENSQECVTPIYDKYDRPVVQVCYSRFSSQKTGVFEYEGNLTLSKEYQAIEQKRKG